MVYPQDCSYTTSLGRHSSERDTGICWKPRRKDYVLQRVSLNRRRDSTRVGFSSPQAPAGFAAFSSRLFLGSLKIRMSNISFKWNYSSVDNYSKIQQEHAVKAQCGSYLVLLVCISWFCLSALLKSDLLMVSSGRVLERAFSRNYRLTKHTVRYLYLYNISKSETFYGRFCDVTVYSTLVKRHNKFRSKHPKKFNMIFYRIM